MIDLDHIHSLWQRYQQGRGNELFGEIELILQETSADWTIFWRQLARIAEKYATGEKPGESASDEILQSTSLSQTPAVQVTHSTTAFRSH